MDKNYFVTWLGINYTYKIYLQICSVDILKFFNFARPKRHLVDRVRWQIIDGNKVIIYEQIGVAVMFILYMKSLQCCRCLEHLPCVWYHGCSSAHEINLGSDSFSK